MKLKRALSLFMTAIFLSSSMPLNAFAEDISVDESTIVAADTTASGSDVPKIDFVERHVKRGEQCYSTISSTVPDFLPYIGLVTLADLGVSTNGMSVLHFPQVENDTLYNSKHFSSFLDHYIDGNGTTYHINSEDMAQIIFSQKRNIEHFENNKYSIQKAAEELCANGNTIYIATAGTNDFKSTCYKKQSCSHADNSIIYYDNVIALDWGYSIGEALCGMVAKVDYRDDCYFMDLKYYLIDTYEFPVHWSIADSKSALDINAHNLHERGLAREYIIIGEYDQTIAWKKGTLDEPKPKITVFSNDYNNDPIS